MTNDAFVFEYDRAWKRLEQTFGTPSWMRMVRMALVLGVPLICIAATCVAGGLWHIAIYPLFFGLLLLLAPLLSLFDEEYSFPDSIPRNSVQSIVAAPPTTWKLSTFTITYNSDGNVHKTGFCLPAAKYRERATTFRAVTEAFAQSGITIDNQKNQSA